MKQITNFIKEGLKINSKTRVNEKAYHPKDKDELKELIKQLLDERGKDAYLNDIDTSKITNMSELFNNLDPHNIDISKWDVSNVTNMYGVFLGCENFNSDLSKWDVSNVTYMNFMFSGCKNFNSDLSNWDVSKNVDMRKMFVGSEIKNNPPKWYKDK